jgi:hypothetical protein
MVDPVNQGRSMCLFVMTPITPRRAATIPIEMRLCGATNTVASNTDLGFSCIGHRRCADI